MVRDPRRVDAALDAGHVFERALVRPDDVCRASTFFTTVRAGTTFVGRVATAGFPMPVGSYVMLDLPAAETEEALTQT